MLNPTQLARSLATDWLPGDDGPHAANVAESADAFGRVVADWYQTAMAAGIPVATAQARRGILTALAVPALSSGTPATTAQILGNGVTLYMTGQVFGHGVSTPPVAQPAGVGLFTNAFTVLDLDRDARAQLLALGIFLMAVSGLVVFSGPPFTAPVF